MYLTAPTKRQYWHFDNAVQTNFRKLLYGFPSRRLLPLLRRCFCLSERISKVIAAGIKTYIPSSSRSVSSPIHGSTTPVLMSFGQGGSRMGQRKTLPPLTNIRLSIKPEIIANSFIIRRSSLFLSKGIVKTSFTPQKIGLLVFFVWNSFKFFCRSNFLCLSVLTILYLSLLLEEPLFLVRFTNSTLDD